MSTDWPTAPWLALDRDGDGMIRDGSELFGSATPMSTGGHAPHGFAALAELDSNADGKITAADARFGELVLWTDLDGDRVGALWGAELEGGALDSAVSVAVASGAEIEAQIDGHDREVRERAELVVGATAFGEVVDVRLTCH